MRKNLEIEVKVGLFVTLGVVLIMLAVLIVGSGGMEFFKPHDTYTAEFPNVEGLITGSKVVIGGLQVGTVKSIDFNEKKHDVMVTLDVEAKYHDWIRDNAYVEILTQGMLGDKFISINPGTPEQPVLASGAEIPGRRGKELTEFVSQGDQLVMKLNSVAASLDTILKNFSDGNRDEVFFDSMSKAAKNLSVATEKLDKQLDGLQLKRVSDDLHSILDKVNSGTGTLGALVNDPSLYDDVKALMGGANRNRVVRNLVRQTLKSGVQKQEAGDGSNGTKTE